MLNTGDVEDTHNQMIFFEKEFEHFTSRDFRQITAPAGTLIIFDTNTPHLAGTPFQGRERHIIRFDLSKLAWQPGLRRKLAFAKSALGLSRA